MLHGDPCSILFCALRTEEVDVQEDEQKGRDDPGGEFLGLNEIIESQGGKGGELEELGSELVGEEEKERA